ncbi:MAG: NAD-dependent epimerase/dehydratase family protein [Thermoleophilia bacterium]|jgi:dihydroflavonol-4-reductase|nr:NAD-dependent epimerase/dehydratase family protein [Thermoleophilia bacterium]
MSRVLVTGATGFIGHHVAAALRDRGHEVRALVRPGGPGPVRLPEGVEAVGGDLLDRASVARAADGAEAVVHVAAHYALWRREAARVMRVNVDGTANVIAAARAAGARLVHTSSVATIGIPAGGGPGDEDTPQPPGQVIGAYKRSKVLAERLVLDAARRGQWAVVVNPSAPVGPGDWRPTPTGRIVLDVLRRRMPAFVDTGLNLIDVRDVAAGHVLALERGVPGRRYILGNEDLTLESILRLIAGITGQRPPRVRLPHAVAIGVAAVDEVVEGRIIGRAPLAPLDGALMARKRMFFSPARAVRELGLPQSPVGAALRDAVAWYRANGYVRGGRMAA